MRGESRSVRARDEGTWTKAKAKTMKANIALGRNSVCLYIHLKKARLICGLWEEETGVDA